MAVGNNSNKFTSESSLRGVLSGSDQYVLPVRCTRDGKHEMSSFANPAVAGHHHPPYPARHRQHVAIGVVSLVRRGTSSIACFEHRWCVGRRGQSIVPCRSHLSKHERGMKVPLFVYKKYYTHSYSHFRTQDILGRERKRGRRVFPRIFPCSFCIDKRHVEEPLLVDLFAGWVVGSFVGWLATRQS